MPVHFPDGVYHLRYLKWSRRVWEGVGSDAQLAAISKLWREKSLEARALSMNAGEDEIELSPKTDLRDTVAEYITKIKVHRSKNVRSLLPNPQTLSSILLEVEPRRRRAQTRAHFHVVLEGTREWSTHGGEPNRLSQAISHFCRN